MTLTPLKERASLDRTDKGSGLKSNRINLTPRSRLLHIERLVLFLLANLLHPVAPWGKRILSLV
jgi:hypothetical protein